MATETLARGASLDIALRIPVGFADGYLAGWVPTSQIRTLSDQLIATLDVQWVPSLVASVESLMLPQGAGYVWAAGESADMVAVRKAVLAKPGVDAKRMRIASYWKRGVADHHETLG